MTTIWRRGDDFVDIDDMLFDELDLSWLLRQLYHCHYDSYCDGRYNGQDGCCDCSYDPTTKTRPPEELKKRRQKATGGGDYGYWQLRRHLCLLYMASEALESLKYIGFDISSTG